MAAIATRKMLKEQRKSQEIVVIPGFSDLVTRTGLENVVKN